MKLYGAEEAGYEWIGGKVFDRGHAPQENNLVLKRVWEKLTQASLGTLSVPFDDLYYLAGAWSPGYNLKGELGQKPPQANFEFEGFGIIEILFPAYRSLWYRQTLRPAILDIYMKKIIPELAGYVVALIGTPLDK